MPLLPERSLSESHVIASPRSAWASPLAIPGPVCDDIAHCRTLWHVILSCALTVWACTWVCLHLNVPPEGEGKWRRLRRHAGITLMAVIAPELVVTWALRQWFVARQLTDTVRNMVSSERAKKLSREPAKTLSRKPAKHWWWTYYSDGWTHTHSFFAIMGGYVMYKPVTLGSHGSTHRPEDQEDVNPEEDGEAAVFGEQEGPINPDMLNEQVVSRSSPQGTVLDVHDIRQLLESGDSCAGFTKEEIADKGKKDGLSKFVAATQALYFVANCLARAVVHLPLSQLELATCAFAVLNGITYFLWADKPHNVGYFLPVGRVTSWFAAETKANGKSATSDGKGWRSSPMLCYTILPFLDMISPTSDYARQKITPGLTYVPTFYAGDGDMKEYVKYYLYLATSGVSVVFGAIHCIAWDFEFPSVAEKDMWRASALVITVFPMAGWLWWQVASAKRIKFIRVANRFWHISVGSGILLYILARIALVGITLSSLRALPSEILDATSWTQVIPHLW